MFSCIIIEDDQLNRVLLSHLIKNGLKEVEIIGTFDNVEEAMDSFHTLAPDIIFLDIEMPGKSGLEFLSEIELGHTEVIVVTGHEEYAIQALKMSVIDYLIKPITKEDIIVAFKKFKDKTKLKQELNRYQILVQNINQDKKQNHKIGLTQHDAIIFVDVNDIIRCEASSNYTNVITSAGKKIVVTKTLRQFEDLLITYGFIRVHRSHLVNPDYVIKLHKGEGLQIELNDGTIVDVANSQKAAIVDRFIKF
jgi:two-component system, LytTR family, response regulator